MTPVLWHVVRAYGLSSAAAEDAVQTTWLTLVRKQDSIDSPDAVMSWLLTTVRREAWRLSRVDRRAVTIEDIEARLPLANSAEDEAARRIESSQLWRAVRGLDDRCQRLLRVVAFSARPNYGMVALDLDMPIGSIGPTRRRCLTKLRSALGEGDAAE